MAMGSLGFLAGLGGLMHGTAEGIQQAKTNQQKEEELKNQKMNAQANQAKAYSDLYNSGGGARVAHRFDNKFELDPNDVNQPWAQGGNAALQPNRINTGSPSAQKKVQAAQIVAQPAPQNGGNPPINGSNPTISNGFLNAQANSSNQNMNIPNFGVVDQNGNVVRSQNQSRSG